MRLAMVLCVALCAILVGCGSPKSPSADQIMAELDGAVKKENPQASAKLTDIAMEPGGKAVKVKFTCTNCMLESRQDVKEIVPSAEGDADVWLDPQDGNWKFQQILIKSKDGAMTMLSSLTGKKF